MSNTKSLRQNATQSVCAVTSLAVCGVLSLLISMPDARSNSNAQTPVFSSGFKFAEQDGESLYRNVCSACHMMDGTGAIGAGDFPSLVSNSKLQSAAYPLHVVTNGLRGMPALGEFMNDDQVAAIVNYVRTHFGNNYLDPVTAVDAKAARP
jgi:mono/diheme cytochrome c family protein